MNSSLRVVLRADLAWTDLDIVSLNDYNVFVLLFLHTKLNNRIYFMIIS